jgi:magnesium chelatase family protein
MNLCPCGARGDPAAECSCSPQRLASFRDKLSRALLDRFDLVVTVPRPRAVELASRAGEASDGVRARVSAARDGPTAARTQAADELLSRAVDRLPLSARGRARVARVARTVAALAGAEAVEPEHVAEALSYRSPRELER